MSILGFSILCTYVVSCVFLLHGAAAGGDAGGLAAGGCGCAGGGGCCVCGGAVVLVLVVPELVVVLVELRLGCSSGQVATIGDTLKLIKQ